MASKEIVLSFPLYAVGTPGRRTRGLVKAVGTGGTKAIVVFNNRSLAEAYKNGAPTGYELRPILDQLAWFGFLVLLQKEGYENVVFNPTIPPDTTGTAAFRVVDLCAETAKRFD